jgi:hypothetical protein
MAAKSFFIGLQFLQGKSFNYLIGSDIADAFVIFDQCKSELGEQNCKVDFDIPIDMLGDKMTEVFKNQH